MGKQTKSVSYPSNTKSITNINGMPVAESYIKNGTMYSNYYSTPQQQELDNYINNAISSALPQLNSFLPETIEAMNKEMEAYTQKGVNYINNLYTPMIQKVQNDSAARFGNLDNSIFLDNLNKIESKRSDAMSSFTQDVQSKQNQLANNELQKQYNYLNMLMNYQNQNLQNAYNAARLNQSNLSMNNAYQNNLYNANLNSGYSASDWAQLASTVASQAAMIAPYFL